jgi:hypothetical protein
MHKKYDLFILGILGMLIFVQSMSFAETDGVIRSGAELLEEYGIVSGYNGDLMTDKSLTRAEACVLLSELHHEKSAAAAAVYRQYFTDVDASAWYAPYVTYARKQSWIGGYPDGSFMPENAINAREWASMMMTLLGYPYTWDTIEADVSALGINFSAEQFDSFNRGEAFELLWQVLNTKGNGNDVMLGASLGYFADSEASNAASTDASVLGYMTPSLRMIRLKLDTALNPDSVTSEARFVLTDSKGASINTVKINYDEATQEILIVMAQPRPTYDVISLEAVGLVQADGTPIKKISVEDIEMIDIVYPAVIRAEATDVQTLMIYFSEPVQVFGAGSIGLPDSNASVASVELSEDGMTAKVILLENDVAPQTVKCFNTIKDDYGHQLNAQSVSVELTASFMEDANAGGDPTESTSDESELNNEAINENSNDGENGDSMDGLESNSSESSSESSSDQTHDLLNETQNEIQSETQNETQDAGVDESVIE